MVFRVFSVLFYPSAQFCRVLWFGGPTLLLTTESLLVGFQCIEVFNSSAVGSVFPVGSVRVAHNHCLFNLCFMLCMYFKYINILMQLWVFRVTFTLKVNSINFSFCCFSIVVFFSSLLSFDCL